MGIGRRAGLENMNSIRHTAGTDVGSKHPILVISYHKDVNLIRWEAGFHWSLRAHPALYISIPLWYPMTPPCVAHSSFEFGPSSVWDFHELLFRTCIRGPPIPERPCMNLHAFIAFSCGLGPSIPARCRSAAAGCYPTSSILPAKFWLRVERQRRCRTITSMACM